MLALKTSIFIFALTTLLGATISISADESPVIHNPPPQQKTEEATNKKANSKTPYHNTATPIATVNPTPSPPLQKISDKEHQKYNDEEEYPWWNFSLTDALLVIFTCGLVIVGWLQICILKGTLKATEKAANAADENARVLPIMERAYIFSNIEVDRQIDNWGEEFNAILYLINHGKTPAIIKEIGFMGYKEPSDNQIIPLHIHHPVHSIIGSGEKFEEDHHWFTINMFELGKLITTNPQIKLFCLGYVKYITVFGDEDCHTFYWEFYAPELRFVLVQNEKLNHDT